MSEWTNHDSVDLSVTLVAHDGHRLPLRGAERVAAIQIMVRLQVPAAEMARRLCVGREALATAARRAGIELPQEDLRRWVVIADLRPSLGALPDRERRAIRVDIDAIERKTVTA